MKKHCYYSLFWPTIRRWGRWGSRRFRSRRRLTTRSGRRRCRRPSPTTVAGARATGPTGRPALSALLLEASPSHRLAAVHAAPPLGTPPTHPTPAAATAAAITVRIKVVAAPTRSSASSFSARATLALVGGKDVIHLSPHIGAKTGVFLVRSKNAAV
jgi:hypothetical protein